jgi:hypothetical protein
MICPLGRDLRTETCPSAPCVGCMRALGEQIIADYEVLSDHRKSALSLGRTLAYKQIDGVMTELQERVAAREHTPEPEVS